MNNIYTNELPTLIPAAFNGGALLIDILVELLDCGDSPRDVED